MQNLPLKKSCANSLFLHKHSTSRPAKSQFYLYWQLSNFLTCERLLPRYGDSRILVNERQRNVVVAVIAIGTESTLDKQVST